MYAVAVMYSHRTLRRAHMELWTGTAASVSDAIAKACNEIPAIPDYVSTAIQAAYVCEAR